MAIEIITTSDGSHSLLNSELNETYHSVHGALQESIHVFIRMGFDHVLDNKPEGAIRILEVGFGTGLNAFLTAKRATEVKREAEYLSLETFPIPSETWHHLNYTSHADDTQLFQNLHEVSWNQRVRISDFFSLFKVQQSLQTVSLDAGEFDLIYFDAFAPNKQPEMWTLEVLNKVVTAIKPGGIFVTYCAKGQLKRDLRALGMEVSTLAGPPGKKEMVRAKKL